MPMPAAVEAEVAWATVGADGGGGVAGSVGMISRSGEMYLTRGSAAREAEGRRGRARAARALMRPSSRDGAVRTLRLYAAGGVQAAGGAAVRRGGAAGSSSWMMTSMASLGWRSARSGANFWVGRRGKQRRQRQAASLWFNFKNMFFLRVAEDDWANSVCRS
jgi:hypothetical protein